MLPRLPALAALGALASLACYASHFELSDASGPPEHDADALDDATPRDDSVVPDDAGADVTHGLCTGDDIISAAELVARAAELHGRLVRVRGTVAELGPRGCTNEPCPTDEPCCNVCSVAVLLAGADGRGPRITGSGAAEPGCQGDECHLVCTPYDVGRGYVLRGTYEMSTGLGDGTLSVVGAPGDVCQDEPPPDHRGAYRVWARRSTLDGECARWAPVVGSSGYVFASIGDPGVLEMWQGLAAPPAAGRFEGTIEADGSRATFSAAAHWSCCDHLLDGVFPDNRAIEATLTVHEDGAPRCEATFELVGMRQDAACAADYADEPCFRAGGIRARVGPDTGVVCSCPTFDGDETCANDAACEAACLARVPDGGSCATLGSGHCTGGRNWAGCYCWLESGPTGYVTCWD